MLAMILAAVVAAAPAPQPVVVAKVKMFAGEKVAMRAGCAVVKISGAPEGLAVSTDARGRLWLTAAKKTHGTFRYECADGTPFDVEVTVEPAIESKLEEWPETVTLAVGEIRIFKLSCQVSRIAVSDGVFDVKTLGRNMVQLEGFAAGKHTELIWCSDGKRIARMDVGEE